MLRLYFLVERCYKLREPVLLVGETGGGKTTVCQLLSMLLDLDLLILNCHQYSETSDFIGVCTFYLVILIYSTTYFFFYHWRFELVAIGSMSSIVETK